MEQMSVMINNHLLNIKWSVKRKGTGKWGMGKAMMTEQWGEGYKGRGIGILYILLLQVLSHFLPTIPGSFSIWNLLLQ